MLVARSKTDFVFIFFILGTFLVLKGGWGTPKVGLVQKTIGKVIGRCVGNLGNIVCTSNPNNGQGHQNAQGLAAMRSQIQRESESGLPVQVSFTARAERRAEQSKKSPVRSNKILSQ